MTKFTYTILFILITAFAIAQETSENKKKPRLRKQLKATTKIQINQLKDGALLVRLKTKKISIDALRKIGKAEQANQIELAQLQLNLKIIAAFKANFNFCPTYFFNSDYSTQVKEKQFDKVVFLNSNLQPDSSIKFEFKTFLVAEFGKVEQDTAKHLSHYTNESDQNWSVKQVPHYYGGPYLGFDALIVSSDNLIQLRHPFPYYVRTRDATPNERVLNRTIKLMNKKLHKFYLRKNQQ